MPALDFIRSDDPQIHFRRRREILAAHPEMRELAGPYRLTPLIIVALVGGQLALAYVLRDAAWWLLLVAAYVGGAVLSHALYVMIHECTHNLAARSTLANRLWGIVCDVALAFPGALAFRTYHLLHHRYLGEPEMDADMAARLEGRLVKNSWWRKALWMFFFGISQALRPMKTKAGRTFTPWTVLNAVVVIGVDLLVLQLWGVKALVFLFASTLFGLGLHPLGGRWIQEHYVTTPGQETYSYYGLANVPAFNVGYHVEHHDFMNVPWVNLPKIRRAAPEFYDGLASYRSWTGVILRFVFDRKLSPFSRIQHPSTAPAAREAAEPA
jgi:sphingolipid delta-4 desaturase